MTIFIDLAGSWIVRAAMVTAMLGLTVTMNETVYRTSQYSNTKEALENVVDIVYTDLNMAGNEVTGLKFYTIQPRNIYFLGDLNGDGSAEAINYYTSYDASTNLYSLYRWVNRENSGRPLCIGSNFTRVKFEYYDQSGVRINPGSEWNVASVRIQLTMKVGGVENNKGITSVQSDVRVFPQNL